ncbi:hypothetical protein CWC02_20790, partial [Pseudoalteromonas sp. S2721]|uniref:YhjD/YihY/BrkB family envelope integrity protein n=1 Tax=Pseudoalteromonas sp. S2721 TaxID=579526 RepID=UPI001278A787
IFIPLLSELSGSILRYTLSTYTLRPCRAAIPGAVFAAMLFELTKKGFALNISLFPSYEVIDGALTTSPILFGWVDLSWIVFLLGADFSVCIIPENI